MENVPELLRLLVQALALFATTLDRWLQIPWPLFIAVLFLPVVAALDVVVWYLRGMTFPVECGYLKVREKGRCIRRTLGEWHKCWYHSRRRLRKTDQHVVDPDMRRWKTGLYEDESAESARVVGRGFLSMRSDRDTLLYHQGLARLPGDVFRIIPTVLHDYKSRAVERWASLKSLGLRGLIPLSDKGNRQVATSHVLPGVISATRLTLALVALGLVLVGISIAVPTAISVILEYSATFLFIIGFAVTRAGIWRAEPAWLRLSSRQSVTWIAGLTSFAACTGLVGLYADEVVNVGKTVIEVGFNAPIAVVAIFACYKLGFSKRKRRRRRRW